MYCRKETVKKYLPSYFTLQLSYDDNKKTTKYKSVVFVKILKG